MPQATSPGTRPMVINGAGLGVAKAQSITTTTMSTVNTTVTGDSTIALKSGSPPPIEHYDANYIPLGLVIQRLVQFSYNNLLELVDKMAAQGVTEGARKAILMDYSNETRKEFLKIIVLLKWSQDVNSISQVIDLKIYFNKQQQLFNDVVWRLAEIRRTMIGARVPNPDLETAVQVLASGQTDTAMMRRYVPPPPLTSAETLRYLKKINTLLALRIGLNETLPDHFHDYRIVSGRAIFYVKDEFEVDLSIGDEEASTQFYVVDVRPLFRPAERPLPKKILDSLESHGNNALKERGLEGIYELLHNFFMNNKLAIVSQQTETMMKGRWAHALRIRWVRRTLVIQYWIGHPAQQYVAPKRAEVEPSWLEIGVRRGSNGKPSRLAVRWFREKQEVKQEIPFNIARLSAGKLIQTAIALHVKDKLTALHIKLNQCPIFEDTLTLRTSDVDAFASKLTIRLTAFRTVTLAVEPVSGLFSIQRQSLMTAAAEHKLNHLAENTYFHTVLTLKFRSFMEEVENRAKTIGWTILQGFQIRKEDLRRWIPSINRMYHIKWLRRPSWPKTWVLAIVIDSKGIFAWVLELNESQIFWEVSVAEQLQLRGDPKVSFQFMQDLEKLAAAAITHFVNARELAKRNIAFSIKGAENHDHLHLPDLNIRFSSITKADWGIDRVKLSFKSLAPNGVCSMIALGRTNEPMTQLAETNIAKSDSDVSFHPLSGSFAIKFDFQIGENVISPLSEKIQRIERLIRFVTVIRKCGLNCLHVELGRIVLRYSEDPPLTAELRFSGEKGGLTLVLAPGSPHKRLEWHLQNILNAHGLDPVLKGLAATLDLLIAIEEIEKDLKSHEPSSNDNNFNALFIIPRNLHWWVFEFKRASVVLDLRLKTRRSKALWYLTDPCAPPKQFNSPPDRVFCEQVSALWEQEAASWQGLRTGAVADVSNVKDLVRSMYKLMKDAGALKGPLPRTNVADEGGVSQVQGQRGS